MIVKIFEGHWTINDVRTNKNFLFIFGDNDVKRGKGGQATIRDEPNAIGIPTKKFPDMREYSFYTDRELKTNIIGINVAYNNIINKLRTKKYLGIVLPNGGIGTGLADLPKRAPITFAYLQKIIDCIKNECMEM